MPLADAPDGPIIPEYRIAAGAVFIPVVVPDPTPPLKLEGDIRLLHAPLEVKPLKAYDADRLLAALAPFVRGAKCDSNNVCPHYHRYLMNLDGPRATR